MTPPALARPWQFALLLAGILFLSGCATTNSTSADRGSAESRMAQRSMGHDGLAVLLARIEAAEARSQRNPFDRLTNPVESFVDQALAVLGTRYRYGGTSPDVGFDCSGLIWFAANEAVGVELPRTTAALARHGKQIKRAELQPGDLVFFNTLGRRFSHVGIYLGDGDFVHAPSSGGVVRVENMSVRYWNSRFNGARRISYFTQLAAN